MESSNPNGMFTAPEPEKRIPAMAAGIAAMAVLVLAGLLVAMGRHHAPVTATQESAAYIPNLEVGDLQMSEAAGQTTGRLIYIDGHIVNHGNATVRAVTVQVMFANDEALAPQVETIPMALIYMREPYVDTHPVSAAPLGPGAGADFRLIFDDIEPSWNQQTPTLRIVKIDLN